MTMRGPSAAASGHRQPAGARAPRSATRYANIAAPDREINDCGAFRPRSLRFPGPTVGPRRRAFPIFAAKRARSIIHRRVSPKLRPVISRRPRPVIGALRIPGRGCVRAHPNAGPRVSPQLPPKDNTPIIIRRRSLRGVGLIAQRKHPRKRRPYRSRCRIRRQTSLALARSPL